MTTKLTEAARVYLGEHTLLEKARRDLHDALDATWRGAWERAKPDMERITAEYGAGIILWVNDSSPGHYEVRTNAKVRKLPVSLVVRDPRMAREGEGIELVLYLRTKERRDTTLSDLRKRFEKICEEESMGPIEWRKASEIWLKMVPIADDLESTSQLLADEMLTVLRVITKFEAETQG